MDEIVSRLRKRADIRRGIPRSEPDRIADILEEAANRIVDDADRIHYLTKTIIKLMQERNKPVQ